MIERFTAAGIPADRITCERDTFVFVAPVSPSEYLTWFRDFYGPKMNAYAAAETSGRVPDLHRELDALFNAKNESRDKNSTKIPATYLRVTVRR